MRPDASGSTSRTAPAIALVAERTGTIHAAPTRSIGNIGRICRRVIRGSCPRNITTDIVGWIGRSAGTVGGVTAWTGRSVGSMSIGRIRIAVVRVGISAMIIGRRSAEVSIGGVIAGTDPGTLAGDPLADARVLLL